MATVTGHSLKDGSVKKLIIIVMKITCYKIIMLLMLSDVPDHELYQCTPRPGCEHVYNIIHIFCPHTRETDMIYHERALFCGFI